MSLSIHLTTDWPHERFVKYSREITAAMVKLVERYPNELSLKEMAKDIVNGVNQLWVILDEDKNFKAFVTSEVKESPDGYKFLLLGELAGEGGLELVSMIHPIEEWARSQGIREIKPLGRIGWRKALAAAGYEVNLIQYRKELTDG